VSVIGFIAYAFKGIGKFAAIFFPWHISPDMYAIILMSLTAIYAVKGGMFSVVITEVLQFFVLTIASLSIGILAIYTISPEQIQANDSPWMGNSIVWLASNLDWTGIIDSVNNKNCRRWLWALWYFLYLVAFQGVLKSIAGPAPNYDMQRVLATRSPKEAAKMNWFVNVVLIFRAIC